MNDILKATKSHTGPDHEQRCANIARYLTEANLRGAFEWPKPGSVIPRPKRKPRGRADEYKAYQARRTRDGHQSWTKLTEEQFERFWSGERTAEVFADDVARI